MVTSRAFGGRRVTSVLADKDPPVGCGLQAGHDPEYRRLPATRGAEERHQFPRLDLKTHPIHRAYPTESLGDIR